MNAALSALLLLPAWAPLVQRGADRAPTVGTMAPPIVAESLDSKAPFELAANIGKRPTVLIFGSCT